MKKNWYNNMINEKLLNCVPCCAEVCSVMNKTVYKCIIERFTAVFIHKIRDFEAYFLMGSYKNSLMAVK